MARPRFHKLPPSQQRAIEQAAVHEFATHGFGGASLNRIIEAAGISKGSMYYYFDGKDDLYAHVARVELEGLLGAAGPFPVPSDRDADGFWSTLETYYLRVMEALVATPVAAALARDWLVASSSPALQQAQKEMESALLPWFDRTIAVGQRVLAVRKDVPKGLLVAVVFAIGQAADGWIMTQQPDAKGLRKLVRLSLGMIRRALEP